MKTDIEIAHENEMKDITEIARDIGLDLNSIEQYGKYKAKVDIENINIDKKGKIILVTAITPTPFGEGKTTVSIGIADALSSYLKKENKNVMLALREPSLGPVFGIKGGACGGGYSQIVPMEDINLHFTGDFHAIGAANNLLAAMLDNHIQHGNDLQIDSKTITWKRVVDMNDRQLRNIVNGLGGYMQGVPREDGFEITVASEVMAIFCLSSSLLELKEKLGNIIVAYTFDGKPIKASDLKAHGAMTALLKDAFKPNLVQTLEHTPALVHGGPFANIAHGCNSLIATKTASKLANYVVTEAGFGADLGAEKFLDIKCRYTDLLPSVVVVVATIRALKMHGGAAKMLNRIQMKEKLKIEDLQSLEAGFANLHQHITNIKEIYNLPCMVVLNVFDTDTNKEINLLKKLCNDNDIKFNFSNSCLLGSKDSEKIAKSVIEICKKNNSKFRYCYELKMSIKEKIESIAKKVYRANKVIYSLKACKMIKKINDLGYNDLPICIAKTQYSFSDDQTKICVPNNFNINVTDIKLNAGAGFIVCYAGNVLTMPGLPKIPAAENIDINNNGDITGLF